MNETRDRRTAHGPVDRRAIVAMWVLAALVAGMGYAVYAEGRHTGPWTLRPLAVSTAPPAAAEPTAAVVSVVDTQHLELTSNPVASPAPGAPPGPRAASAWVDTLARSTGIPVVALQAYADATLALAVERPACRVGWTTLAALGAIESSHGTHGGAVLRPDGTTSVRILGPALDGSPGRAAIRATPASTAWHGDPTWDHAVGPLQFLPSTWEAWGADGDGDGVADPNDIHDAALAAARYLCAAGSDLTGGDAWHAAVFSYNHSEQYVADALGVAERYATESRAARSADAG